MPVAADNVVCFGSDGACENGIVVCVFKDHVGDAGRLYNGRRVGVFGYGLRGRRPCVCQTLSELRPPQHGLQLEKQRARGEERQIASSCAF